jgi:hypothetical protein
MNDKADASGAQVPCISLLAASVALKEYLESPACTIPGFDIPDRIWMPFADAVEVEYDKANRGICLKNEAYQRKDNDQIYTKQETP